VTAKRGSTPAAGSVAPSAEETRQGRLRELEERTAHLEAILESLPDSYARISAEGIFVAFRRPRNRDFAVPVEELRGRHFRDTLPAEAAASWQVAIDEAKASGKTTVFEFILPTKQGRLNREARFTSCGNGEVIAVIRSTTQEKRAQAQFLADRLASLGTLAAGVAHEINNPLMFLLANLELVVETLPTLLSHPDSPAAVAILTALDEARQGGLRVGAIARDLAAFCHDGGDVIGAVDVHPAIESALKLAARTLSKDARVVRDLRPVPKVRGTEGRLVQVLLNLLVNASHAMQGRDATDHAITVSTYMDAEAQVVIAVRDTGVGIPPGTIERIFDPFFTTKTVGVGTGLGLAISHGIVASFGGDLRVESEVGRGTVFFVVLSAWAEPR
jgi:C4-dicarboxylate-specific signal transduction histidine kinase